MIERLSVIDEEWTSLAYPTIARDPNPPDYSDALGTLRRSSRVRRLSAVALEYDFGNDHPERCKSHKRRRIASGNSNQLHDSTLHEATELTPRGCRLPLYVGIGIGRNG